MHPRALLSLTVILGALAAHAAPLRAQSDRAARFLANCDRNGGRDEQFCETRDFTLPASKALNVDGRDNGGIAVHAWNRAEIKVTALIQARGETEAEARELARGITVSTGNAEIRAEGPRSGRRQSWSVSYEIYAPAATELALTASNGGISVDGMQSRMALETVNGGLSLSDVSGDVRGETTNGGIVATLSGSTWQGNGLDLRTTNGGVKLYIPENYSARLETATVNGGIDIGFPVTVQGSFRREISTQLGNGGALIRAVTTNGGVSIRRR